MGDMQSIADYTRLEMDNDKVLVALRELMNALCGGKVAREKAQEKLYVALEREALV